MLKSMGSQRVRRDLVTEQQLKIYNIPSKSHKFQNCAQGDIILQETLKF